MHGSGIIVTKLTVSGHQRSVGVDLPFHIVKLFDTYRLRLLLSRQIHGSVSSSSEKLADFRFSRATSQVRSVRTGWFCDFQQFQVINSASLFTANLLAKMTEQTSSGFTKEEELLLQDFSRNVSTKSNALFYGNAFIISAVPICKFAFRISY